MRYPFACLSAFLLVIAPALAQDVIFPGSTLDGDYLRGQGVFLKGAAWFEIESAKARALDAQTQILVDRYMRELYDSYQDERQARFRLRAARTKAAADAAKRESAARETRLRTAPSEAELASGDALNALLADLSNPTVNPWSHSMPEVSLPDAISVRDLAFQFIPRATGGKDAKPVKRCLIALGRLDKKSRWPAYMNSDLIAKERQAYELAHQNLIKSCLEGKLGPPVITALEHALDELRKAAAMLTKEHDYQRTALQHIDQMKAATAIFDATTIDLAQEMIRDTQTHDARTVGQLLAFMRKYRLMFAPADRELVGTEGYTKLYGAMKVLKEKMGLNIAAPKPAFAPPFFQKGARWRGELEFGEIATKKLINVSVEITSISDTEFECLQANEDGFKVRARGVAKDDGAFTWTYYEFIPTKEFRNELPNLKQLRGVGRIEGDLMTIDFEWPPAGGGTPVKGRMTFKVN